MILIPASGRTASNAAGVFGVPAADQEPQRPARLVQVDEQVAGCLGHPRAGGVTRHPEQVDAAGGDLDAEEHADLVQKHGPDGEEANREDARGPSPQEPLPGLPGPLRGRVNAGGA